MTAFAPQVSVNKGVPGEIEDGVPENRPCYELVSAAIKQGILPPEKPGLASVVTCREEKSPIAIAGSPTPKSPITEKQRAEAMYLIERERYEAAEKNVTAAKKPSKYDLEKEQRWDAAGGIGTPPSSLPAYGPKTPKTFQ